MRSLLAGAALAAAVTGVVAGEKGCSAKSEQINGNWYCGSTKKLDYDIFGQPGSYQEVTNMNSDTGECTQEKRDYSGPMAPFNEELSLHLRGPLKIARVGVYIPKCGEQSTPSPAVQRRHHGHQHLHKHHKQARDIHAHAQVEKRAKGDLVTATIEGNVVTFTDDWSPGQATGEPEAPKQEKKEGQQQDNNEQKQGNNEQKQDNNEQKDDKPEETKPAQDAQPESYESGSGSSSTGSSSTGGGDPSCDWERVGFFDLNSQTLQGMAFLANKGGDGSGVFDMKFGNSLAYASSDGKKGASEPQILDKDLVLGSNNEVILFSDKKCQGGDCGYYRPGTVAHHGFGGADKAFLIEFQMPDDGKTGSIYDSPNMPAIWLLNAKVPRTAQYGPETCSCWKTGCGEFDLFEVLDPGNYRCKSTVHANQALGYSDYFDRPWDNTTTAAIVFRSSANTAHIKVLEDNANFPEKLTLSDVNAFCN